MISLPRPIGNLSDYPRPPRSDAGGERHASDATSSQVRLAAAWGRVLSFWNVLKLIRFSALLAAVCVVVILVNGQAQDALRALGEEPGLPTALFVLAAVICAAVAWWDSRVMFYFRFENPASDPDEMPTVKEFLPRILGGLALLVTGVAVIRASFAYEDWSAPVWWLLGIGSLLIVLAGIFVYLTIMRRKWFNGKEPRPANLRRLHDTPHIAPLVAVSALCFALMVLFAYFPVQIAPWIGTPAIALLAVAGLMPIGSFLVWIGNRYRLPIVTPLLIWALLNSWLFIDSHYVRLHDEMETHTPSEAPPALQAHALPAVMGTLRGYVEGWLEELHDRHPGQPVPVVLVAAEGGGIRAAYWTALVLGQLHDEALARAAHLDFARNTLAISGVSGGSLGAATYAALVTPQPKMESPQACGEIAELRRRAERILDHDFLSPAVAVMLFPDLFQHFVPVAFINDRAKALERSWQAAWDACEAGERFTQPLQNLWAGGAPFATPLLFLNSTVVETGQRMIAAPVPIESHLFSDALDSRKAIGETVPLATAVHNSARFTYLSPAGLLKRNNVPREQWLRVVDGGYFENSGAVTLAEILDLVLEVAKERSFDITPVVVHISNDPETADPEAFDDPYQVAAQIRAPLGALLNTRPARGFQARGDLRRRVLDLNEPGAERAYHFNFRLCREGRKPLPLGWTLSRVAEQEMRRQLGVEDVDPASVAMRNRKLREALLDVLAGERPDPRSLSNGFTCPSEDEQMRLAAGPAVNS